MNPHEANVKSVESEATVIQAPFSKVRSLCVERRLSSSGNQLLRHILQIARLLACNNKEIPSSSTARPAGSLYLSMASNPPSGSSTPNPRFTASAKTAEDLLSTQTVGLVALSDFRKRRAEALEQKERDAQEGLLNGGSGRRTPGSVTPDG